MEPSMPEDREFLRRTGEMMERYDQGDYAAALALTLQIAADFPEQHGRTSFWKICLLTRTGQIPAALQAFEAAIQAGWWWSEANLRRDPDLEPLQGTPEFERLVAVSKERHAAAQAAAEPEMLVREPAPGSARPYPLLIALHGQGGTAQADLPYWEAACQRGWLVAALQSAQLAWPGAYAWDDREAAQRQVVGQFEGLCTRHPVDRSRLIVGGFSQGAALAVRLALNGSLPARGFLAVVPGMIDRELLAEWAAARRPGPVRGYLVAGGRDPRHAFFQQICETLPQHGVPCRMEDHPEMGHEFPPEFEHSLDEGLKFIIG
jgi:predicted esterase